MQIPVMGLGTALQCSEADVVSGSYSGLGAWYKQWKLILIITIIK